MNDLITSQTLQWMRDNLSQPGQVDLKIGPAELSSCEWVVSISRDLEDLMKSGLDWAKSGIDFHPSALTALVAYGASKACPQRRRALTMAGLCAVSLRKCRGAMELFALALRDGATDLGGLLLLHACAELDSVNRDLLAEEFLAETTPHYASTMLHMLWAAPLQPANWGTIEPNRPRISDWLRNRIADKFPNKNIWNLDLVNRQDLDGHLLALVASIDHTVIHATEEYACVGPQRVFAAFYDANFLGLTFAGYDQSSVEAAHDIVDELRLPPGNIFRPDVLPPGPGDPWQIIFAAREYLDSSKLTRQELRVLLEKVVADASVAHNKVVEILVRKRRYG